MAAWSSRHVPCRCSRAVMMRSLLGVLVVFILWQLCGPDMEDHHEAHLLAAIRRPRPSDQLMAAHPQLSQIDNSTAQESIAEPAPVVSKPSPFARSPPRCPAQEAWPVDPVSGRIDATDPTTKEAPLQQKHSGFGVPPGHTVEFGRVASSYAMAMLSMPFWQTRDEYDRHSMSVDLNWVSFEEGRMTIHGLQDWTFIEKGRLEEWMPEYKHFHLGLEYTPQRADQWTTREAPLDLSSCTTIVKESTMFLSGWVWSSLFSSWNDNISPMFSHLRSLGLLDPATSKRLYVWPADDVKTSIWTREQLDILFNRNTFDFDELKKPGKKTCFKHVRWGRGPLLGYVRDASPFSHTCTNLDHLWPIGGSAQHASGNPVTDGLVSASTVDGRTHDLRIRYLHQQSILSGDVLAWQLYLLHHFGIAPQTRPNRLDTGLRIDFLRRKGYDQDTFEAAQKARQHQAHSGQLQQIAPAPSDSADRSSNGTMNENSRKKFRMMKEAREMGLKNRQRANGVNQSSALSSTALSSCQRSQTHPRILWLDDLALNEKGRIENTQEVIDAARRMLGVEVKRCCEWTAASGLSMPDHLSLLQSSDILIGSSSSAFTWQIYLPPGAMVVELQGAGSLHQPNYNRLTRWLDHSHLEIDIRSYLSPFETTALPGEFIERMWKYVLEHWKRQQPCTKQEEILRQQYYDVSKPHDERFHMAGRNMRSQGLHWSLREQ
jgi:hypothetical protein